MKIVVAIDSFKGSLTSLEAGNAIKAGIDKAIDAEVVISPIADGGEGTVMALVTGMGGILRTSTVTGPLGDQVKADWGILCDGDTKTAIIEMASAAGIILVDKEKLCPLYTTSYGVGELIKEAIGEGCRKFIIGIGGSATNDGGAGMLQALGFDLLDTDNNPIKRGAIGLRDLSRISSTNALPELKECVFRVACDVKNPLCGANGCSAIYGPQKGATPEMIQDMDEWLRGFAVLSGGDIEYPGVGAAGGMGFAFRTFMNASLEPGIDIVLEETKLENQILDADVVITGEGRMDSQTIMGKAPIGVATIAKKYGKKVLAFCGCEADGAWLCNEHGIDAYFTILRSVSTLEEALDKDNAYSNLARTTEQVFRLWNAII